jgi:hypothetical protein
LLARQGRFDEASALLDGLDRAWPMFAGEIADAYALIAKSRQMQP